MTWRWRVRLPEQGYYHLADVSLRFKPDPANAHGEYLGDMAYNLYAEIMGNGRVTSSTQIDPAHCPPPVFVDHSADLAERKRERHLTSQYNLNLTITGRVTYKVPVTNVEEAVPGVRVFIDWDEDDDPTTINNPFNDDVTHHSWAVTNRDGYYSFNRHGPSAIPLNLYGHQLRITAERSNEATYNDVLGQESPFLDSVMIDMGDSATNCSITADNLELKDFSEARILRYVWRAREFARINLNHAPPRIPYLKNPDIGVAAFFLQANNPFSNAYTTIPAKNYSRLVYEGNVGSNVSYHEYGHYVEWDNETIPTYPIWPSAPLHDWNYITNKGVAWVEGWAEFYAAAAAAFWYRLERPVVRDNQDATDIHYFPDIVLHYPIFGKSTPIPPTHDSVEGAVATFLYNIWDDVGQRGMGTPTYTGDNEDLGEPRGYPTGKLLIWMKQRWCNNNVNNLMVPPILSTETSQFEAFVDHALIPWAAALYPKTYSYHLSSITALYDHWEMDRERNPKPATPTYLTITTIDGSPNKTHRLDWNDNTEPDSVLWFKATQRDDSLLILDRNNEEGFVIYRKLIPEPSASRVWDGRDIFEDKGYQLIADTGVVGRDVTTFTDPDHLAPGRYSYVVVAWNHRHTYNHHDFQKSIPKAEASVETDGLIAIRKDGWDQCQPITVIDAGQSASYTALAGSITSPTYHWIVENKPSYIEIQGANGATVSIVNHYVPGMPVQGYPAFSLCATISYSGGSDTSGRVYPAYSPYDGSATFIGVGHNGEFITDGNRLRGMEFLTQPGEDVSSIQPLGITPTRDSGNYRIKIKGVPNGKIVYNKVKLLVMDHPVGTVMGGSADCGFKLYDDSTFEEDTVDVPGLREIPLRTALHSRFGSVTSAMLDHDSLETTVLPGDSLLLAFHEEGGPGGYYLIDDTTQVYDTARAGWRHDYFLEVSGVYTEATGGYTTIPAPLAEEEAAATRTTSLGQSRPNPAHSQASIGYYIAHGGPVTLTVYNATGVELRRPIDGVQDGGDHTVNIDLTGLASGVYCYRLTTGGRSYTNMMTVIH